MFSLLQDRQDIGYRQLMKIFEMVILTDLKIDTFFASKYLMIINNFLRRCAHFFGEFFFGYHLTRREKELCELRNHDLA